MKVKIKVGIQGYGDTEQIWAKARWRLHLEAEFEQVFKDE